MKSVLVAGGAGFVGSHLVDRLLRRADIERLVVVDNLWSGRVENLSHIRDPRFHFERCDVEAVQTSHLFDEIYHLASPASPPWYMQQPERTISANLIGAMRLRELLKEDGRFCYTSSSEVYGDPIISPQPESYHGQVDCTGPRSSYDESKRCTEAFLFESQRVRNLDVRDRASVQHLRPSHPRRRRSRRFQLRDAGAHRPPDHDLWRWPQSRSWGYIDDIVEGFERFFWRDTFDYRGPLNIGNDREISVIEVARYVCKLVPGSRIVHLDPVPQDPTNRCPDLTLARQLLPGWSCQIPYELGVKMTIEWFAEQMRREQKAVSNG